VLLHGYILINLRVGRVAGKGSGGTGEAGQAGVDREGQYTFPELILIALRFSMRNGEGEMSLIRRSVALDMARLLPRAEAVGAREWRAIPY
jgi:hypothetical protein